MAAAGTAPAVAAVSKDEVVVQAALGPPGAFDAGDPSAAPVAAHAAGAAAAVAAAEVAQARPGFRRP